MLLEVRGIVLVGLYFAIVDISRKYEISTREVEITLIRTMLKEKHGFVCNHETDKISVSHTKNLLLVLDTNGKVVSSRSSPFAPQKTTFVPKTIIEMEKEQDNHLQGIQFDKRGSK